MTIDPDHFSLPRAFPAIHRAGWPFIALFAALSVGLGLWFEPFFYVGLVMTLWCVAFFRDPERVAPKGENLVVSPADGVILPVVDSPPPHPISDDYGPMRRISVFMNVFDVHVNRIPCDGRIEELVYRPGAFFNASLDKASEDNERMAVRMTAKNGHTVVFAQIAGLIARRILCHLKGQQHVHAGERFGMIRFGSRVDIYVPADSQVQVRPGQRAVCGETVLAVMPPHRRPRGQAVKTRSGNGKRRVSSPEKRSPGTTGNKKTLKTRNSE